MKRDKLLGMYIDVLSNAKAKQFVNQIFSKYDTDNSGSIDFKVQSSKWKRKCFLSHQHSPGIYDGDHYVWRSDWQTEAGFQVRQEWCTIVRALQWCHSSKSLRWGWERDCGQAGDGWDCEQHVHLPGGCHGDYHYHSYKEMWIQLSSSANNNTEPVLLSTGKSPGICNLDLSL